MSLDAEFKPTYTREQCQTLAAKIKSYFDGKGGIDDADVYTAADMLEQLTIGTIAAHHPSDGRNTEQSTYAEAAYQQPAAQKFCTLCEDDGGYFYGRTGYEPCCI